MNTRGSSLVELILYTGLLAILLTAVYQVFSLVGYRKIGEVVEDEIYVNASRAMADVVRNVQLATSITEPAAGASSQRLSLNGGTIVYSLDADNRLQKTEGGVTNFLTTETVGFNALTFSRHGPSVQSQTIGIDFTIAGVHEVEGRVVTREFTSSATVR